MTTTRDTRRPVPAFERHGLVDLQSARHDALRRQNRDRNARAEQLLAARPDPPDDEFDDELLGQGRR